MVRAHIEAIQVAIDLYAEAAFGNCEFCLNKPHSIGPSRSGATSITVSGAVLFYHILFVRCSRSVLELQPAKASTVVGRRGVYSTRNASPPSEVRRLV